MTKKQEQTASFLVRFQQRIFEENGESEVQWRGKISHVQDGEEQRFSDFNDALSFNRSGWRRFDVVSSSSRFLAGLGDPA